MLTRAKWDELRGSIHTDRCDVALVLEALPENSAGFPPEKYSLKGFALFSNIGSAHPGKGIMAYVSMSLECSPEIIQFSEKVLLILGTGVEKLGFR